MKKLKLNRETVSILSTSELHHIQGGAPSIIIIQQTRFCPIPTLAGCTGGPCVETIHDTSIVINPVSGG